MNHRNIILVVVFMLISVSPLFAQEPATRPATQPASPAMVDNDFTGKITTVHIKEGKERGCVLKDARVRMLGDIPFLVGTHVDSGHPQEWRKGRLVWVPANEIIQIVVFDSLEAYEESIAQFRAVEERGL